MNPSCSLCGGPHPFDTTVPSVVWNSVIRAGGLPDYLCLTCIVEAFACIGRSFTAELIGGSFPGGLPIEFRINGQVAEDAADISDENTHLRACLTAERQARETLEQALRHIWDYWGSSGIGADDCEVDCDCIVCRLRALLRGAGETR